MSAVPRNKLIIFKNKDKSKFSNEYSKPIDYFKMPPGSRIVISGIPNSGKSLLVRNIILRRNFKKIFWVASSLSSEEYADVKNVIRYDDYELPEEEDLAHEGFNNLLLFDDINYKRFSKEQMNEIYTIVTHLCSHTGLTCIFVGHQFTSIPIDIRRNASIFVVFKQADLVSLQKEILKQSLNKSKGQKFIGLLKNNHDALTIDNTPGLDYNQRFRFNHVIPVRFKEDENKE